MSSITTDRVALPRWLGGWKVSPSTAFAILYLFTTFCRSLVLSIVPIQAHSYLGSAQAVSVLYLAMSAAGICASLLTPALVLRIRARGMFHLAAGATCIAAVCLGMPSLRFFLIGMVVWVFSTLAFEITMNLYIMHQFRRRELAAFEPKRMLFSVTAYCIGPWLGVFLEAKVAHWTPFVLMLVMATLSVVYFRFLGLREAGARKRIQRTPNPLRHVRRFFAQPRLQLAWGIALARSAWWATFFIYAPIYAVTSGLGETAGGALVSMGVAMVYTVAYWGRVGRRYGLRRLLTYGSVVTGLASIVVSLFAGTPWLGAGLLMFSTLCAATIDGAGNVPYLRAVRTFEREEMTGVFITYRDASQLLPPAIFAGALRFLPVHAVFGIAGLWMLALAWYCRYLPRRL